MLLDDRTGAGEDGQLQSLAHGVVCLEQMATDYGSERRRLRVTKLRGVAFCISVATAEALSPLSFARVAVAGAPNQDAILDLVSPP